MGNWLGPADVWRRAPGRARRRDVWSDLPIHDRADARLVHFDALDAIGGNGTLDQGLFAQDYRKPDGTTARMLSTQFESTDARRMFPSWDEPAFRSTFQLTVTLPAAWAAVSNMPAASNSSESTRTGASGR